MGKAKVRLRQAGTDVSVCLQDMGRLSKRGASLGGAVAGGLLVRALRQHFSGSGGPVMQMRQRVGISAGVNLRGELLPVAGLRGKLQVARRAECRLVVLASANGRELEALCRRLEGRGGDGGGDEESGEVSGVAPDMGLATWIRERVKLASDVVDLLCLTVEGGWLGR